ncbi:hypothetical protein [Sphaerotilus hippei]|nr:hypothetical protein [Sphaerotilus hippei]
MLALTLGLWMVATLLPVVAHQLQEQRRLLRLTRLTQDLRISGELIARDLRRSGHWGSPADALWRSAADGPRPANPYQGVLVDTASHVVYRYSRDPQEDQVAGSNESFGLRVHPVQASLDLRLSGPRLAPGTGDQWQALTDPEQVRVTRLQISLQTRQRSLLDACAVTSCTGTGCGPARTTHLVTIELTLASRQEPDLQRSWRSTVLLRNAERHGECPSP